MSDPFCTVREVVVSIPKNSKERLLHLRPFLSCRGLSVKRPLVVAETVFYEISLNSSRLLLVLLRLMVKRAQVLLSSQTFKRVCVVREHR